MNRTFIVGIALLLAQKSLSAILKDQIKAEPMKPVVVAVIDTGADIKHNALKEFIWTNPGETGLDKWGNNKETNAIDDDGNGYADDIHGWNFINNNNDLLDSMGHGTHISGVIKSESSKSPSLLNKKRKPVRLMILKYYDPDATDSENIENTIKAINYSVRMGANVINYSGGGSMPNKLELAAIENANKKQILFVAAAGNNKRNTDILNYYPANYKLPNIISVAATDKYGDLMSFSNYGANSIDIAAVGQHVFSTLPDNKFGFMSGTSQSTAFVSGAVALKLSESGGLVDTNKMLSSLIREGKFNKTLVGKTKFQTALLSDNSL